MKTKTPFTIILTLFACLTLTSTGEIITPAAASSATGNLSNRPIEEAINGNGLSGGGTSGDILSETHNVNSGGSGEYWIGTVSGAALTFTLPAASTVDSVHLWTYSRTTETDRGIASFDISFSTDGGSNFGLPISVTGVLAGDYPNPITVQSFSFASQSGVTHIRLNNIVNHGDPTYVGLSEIRFGASGGVDADTSTVAAAPSSVIADGISTSTITVTLKDGSGTPVAGKLVTLDGDTDNATIEPAGAGTDTSNASGVASFTVKSSTVETETFTATGDSVVITQTASVAFTSPAVDAATSTVSAAPEMILADGISTSLITVMLKNASGLPLPGKLVTLDGDTDNATIEPAGAGTDTTDANGEATFTVKSSTVETETFTATGDSVVITQTASVAFTSLDVDAGTSTVSASPTTVIADGSSTSLITVTLKNSGGLPLAGKAVALNGDTGNATIEAAGAGTDTTDASGVATFTVKSATAETETFTATGDSVVITGTVSVIFVTPDPPALLVYESFDYTPGSDVNTPLSGGFGFADAWAAGQQGGVITVYDETAATVTNDNAGGELTWDGVVDNVPTLPAVGSRFIGTSPTTVNATDRITAIRTLSQSAGALAGADKTLWASVVWHQQGSNFGRHVGFALGTDGLSNRSVNVDNSGDAIGVGGAFNTGLVTPVIYNNGNVTVRATTGATSVSFTEDNLVVIKFTFADGAAADTVTAYRFTESEVLSETTFIANAISASAVIDQDTLNILSFSQSRGEEAIDEIRLGNTFDDVVGVTPAQIFSFEAAGATGIIDQGAKTISLEVPSGTDLSTLAPTFTLSSGICDQTSGAPPSPTFAVQNPATYTVTDASTDPDTINAYTVTVTVAPPPPVTATLVIDLGTSPAGTFIEGGQFIGSGLTNLPIPTLPAGSILRSIEVDTVLESSDNGTLLNYASDLAVLLDPTPGTPGGDFSLEITNGTNPFGGAVQLGWPSAANAIPVTPLADTKTDADWAAAGDIDLATTGLFLGNSYVDGNFVAGEGGIWSGTITLTYDVVATGTSYATWSGGAAANGDANGDGVANAVAYALGAADVNENAIGLLPNFDNSDPGNFLFTFDRSDTAEADGTTTIIVEYGTTLTGWTTAPNVGDGVTVDDSGASVGGLTPVIVTIPKSLAPDGRLFARLRVEVSP